MQGFAIDIRSQKNLFVSRQMGISEKSALFVGVKLNFVFGHEETIRIQTLLFEKFQSFYIERNVFHVFKNFNQQHCQIARKETLFALNFRTSQTEITRIIFQTVIVNAFDFRIAEEGGIFRGDLQAGRSRKGRQHFQIVGRFVNRLIFDILLISRRGECCDKIFVKGLNSLFLVGDKRVEIVFRKSERADKLIIQLDASGICQACFGVGDVKRVIVFGKFLKEIFHRIRFEAMRILNPIRAFKHALRQDDFCLAQVASHAENVLYQQFVKVIFKLLRKKFIEIDFVQNAFGKRQSDLE